MSLPYPQEEEHLHQQDVGTLGAISPEISDPPLLLHQKIEQLASMIYESKHLVVFTGAGISSPYGLPNFRGPKELWTLKHQGDGIPEVSSSFDRAMPSPAHMALVELVRVGILKFVITQNVDGLHLRSGLPRDKLAELHGNSFKESCPSCGREYMRDFEVETTGMKKTPRRCCSVDCKERLRDTVLDWEAELPSKEMPIAEKHCQAADLVLCLGTGLQINPGCDLPLKSLQNGTKVVVVNLQENPKDEKANLVIHGLVDKVMAGVMQCLNLRIPPYVRVDLFQVILTRFLRLSDKRYMKWTLRVASVHGIRSPLPYIQSVEVSFPGRPELKTAILSKQPFILKREMIKARPFTIMLKLNFSDGCGTPYTSVEYPVDFQAMPNDVDYGNDAVIQMLKDAAIRDQRCGQLSLIEKKALASPKGEAAVYATATNIAWHSPGAAHSAFFSPHAHGNPFGAHSHGGGPGGGYSLMAPLAPLQTAVPAPPLQTLMPVPPFAVPEMVMPEDSNLTNFMKRKHPELGGPELGQRGARELRGFEPLWPNFLMSHPTKQ